jgi:phage gp36-like protein
VYAVQADMEARFGHNEIVQLTDRAIPPTGAVDAIVLDAALADATARIDGYLQGRFELPLANPPPVLTAYCCDIARYLLYDDRATDQVRKRFEDAIRLLEQVGMGKLSLGLDAGGQPAPEGDSPKVNAADRVFTSDSLSDY